ncbi:MAG: hypothetical protein ACLP7P_21030 [Rhodomicrobium sp.]
MQSGVLLCRDWSFFCIINAQAAQRPRLRLWQGASSMMAASESTVERVKQTWLEAAIKNGTPCVKAASLGQSW